jgi:hypothetical protein
MESLGWHELEFRGIQRVFGFAFLADDASEFTSPVCGFV